MSIGEALVLTYRFFFHLVEYVENEKLKNDDYFYYKDAGTKAV